MMSPHKGHSFTMVMSGLALLFPVAIAAAQDAAPPAAGPAPILEIFREDVRMGHGAAHAQTEAGWIRAFAQANVPVYYLGMNQETGSARAWFATPHASLAAMAEVDKAIEASPGLSEELARLSAEDAGHLTGLRRIVLRYRPDLSNWTGTNIATMRYFELTTFRIRPGHEADFANAAKTYQEVVAKAGVKDQAGWVVYQVIAGLPSPTYTVWVPFKSLADMDDTSPIATAIRTAMTAEIGAKFESLATGFISTETDHLRFNPKLSRLPADFTAADPDFWNPTSGN